MAQDVKLSTEGISINGEYKILLCASLFYFRIPRDLWEKRISDIVKAGYNSVDVYFPWNYHEQNPGEFCFDGEKDVSAFLELCSKYGLYVVARPGPYICSEWNGGGYPYWICGADYPIRSSGAQYLSEVKKWYKQIISYLKPYQITNNGTIIAVQLENELDFYDCGDVDGYIGALRNYAEEFGINVPLVCCSGQSGTAAAGGFVKGVTPTFNFYPSISDPDFDIKCQTYNDALQKEGRPLLVTETGREHQLLKREMMSGAKLLGAYNQVAGSNFGFNQAINNWGPVNFPVSIITTKYDFNSLITTLGDYNEEVVESSRMSVMLDTYGEALARSASCRPDDIKINAGFESSRGGPFALKLYGGGRLLSVANLSAADGAAVITAGALSFTALPRAYETLILPLDMPLDKKGISGKINYSNCELLSAQKGMLEFCSDFQPDISLTVGGRDYNIKSREADAGGVKVKVLTRAEIWERQTAAKKLGPTVKSRYKVPVVSGAIGDFKPAAKEIELKKDLTMEANGLGFGTVVYEAEIPSGKEALLYGAADFVSVYSGREYNETRFMTGNSAIFKPSAAGKYTFKIEKWGHSNFDDSRYLSTLIRSSKGAKNIFAVEKREPLNLWRFKLLDKYELNQNLTIKPDGFDPLISVNSWNSTRLPLCGAYYCNIDVKPFETIMFNIEGGTAECALYANGRLVSAVHPTDRLIDLTKELKPGQNGIALICRKKNWAQRAGNPELLYLSEAKVTAKAYSEKELSGARLKSASPCTLPLKLERGGEFLLEFDLSGFEAQCCMGILKGRDYKATVIMGGRVIARMLAPGYLGISQQGGSDTDFYIPSAWRGDNVLRMYIEAAGENPVIESFELEYGGK